MIARFGNVLYWAGCGIAFLLITFGVIGWFAAGASDDRWFLAGSGLAGAGASWLIGRACLYVLAGR